jgi:hypothetical protein
MKNLTISGDYFLGSIQIAKVARLEDIGKYIAHPSLIIITNAPNGTPILLTHPLLLPRADHQLIARARVAHDLTAKPAVVLPVEK